MNILRISSREQTKDIKEQWLVHSYAISVFRLFSLVSYHDHANNIPCHLVD